MKKVLVIGSGGAGKSTFSRRLGEATGLPLTHLDKLYWKPDWVEPSKDEWRSRVAEIVAADEWILDGNYSGTFDLRVAACDTVIFLDTPRLVCVWRVLKRAAKFRGQTRPDMGAGCEEKLNWEFLKWVWDYPNRTKPRVEEMCKRYQNEKNIVRLKSSSEIEKFLQTNDRK